MATTYTLQRLSAVTGTPSGRVREYERIGVLKAAADDSFSADAVARVNLANYAASRGISDGELERFAREQRSVFESLFGARTSTAAAITSDELLAALPADALDSGFLEAMLEVVGPAEGETLTRDDVDALSMACDAIAMGLPVEALLQMIRVIAEAVDRVAEAENRIFHDYVHERHRAAGLSGQELYDATETLSEPMLAMAEPALLYLHRRAMDRAMRDDFVRHLTEDTRPPATRPGELETAIVFVDLAGFTPLTLTMGDDAAADVLNRFAAIVRTAVSKRRGRIVKQIGDAFMLVFDQPADAVHFGSDLRSKVAQESHFPGVHVGGHYGTVLYRDGDYVGTTVNLAARVAGASASGQFLITAAIRDAVVDSEIAVEELAPAELKGIDAPVAIFEVCGPAGESPLHVDPVCGMHVRRDDEHSTVRVGDKTYYFCSAGCHDRFVDSGEGEVLAER